MHPQSGMTFSTSMNSAPITNAAMQGKLIFLASYRFSLGLSLQVSVLSGIEQQASQLHDLSDINHDAHAYWRQ